MPQTTHKTPDRAAPAAPTSPIGRLRLPGVFELACACCVWPPSAARDARVRVAAEGVDWDRFLRVLGRQRVAGQAREALRSAQVPLPAAVEQRLTAMAQVAAARSLALAAEAVRLRQLLDAAGIAAVFVKGAALAQLAYGSPAMKSARDIDVLVAPDDAMRAFDLLKREGYALGAPAGDLTPAKMKLVFQLHKDLELFNAARRLHLELHWRLVDNPALLSGLGPASPTREVPVLGGSLRTLADADLFAYLAVHGASHCWFRLKWIAELNAWLSRYSQPEIAGFYRHAEALGVDACAGQALLLCERLLGLALPEELRPALRRRKLRLLVAFALEEMAGADAEVEMVHRPFGPFRTLPAQFLRGRGARFFFAQCGLLISSLDDRLMFPLPPYLHFLYPLLRLPLWLLRVRRRGAPSERAAAVARR